MANYLFLYGTLREGAAGKETTKVIKKLQRIGRASIRGRLYDFGAYPGAIIDRFASTSVHGEVVELPEDEKVLKVLDRYEEFDSANPDKSLFVRKKVNAKLSDGQLLKTWMYVYNGKPTGARLIRS